jgi:hypothetical protein
MVLTLLHTPQVSGNFATIIPDSSLLCQFVIENDDDDVMDSTIIDPTPL